MNQKGFTLIELLVSLAVAGIVMAAVYLMYQAQLQTQATQLATVEMNQHARAAMMLLERELRSAGTDPTGYAGAGFITTNANEIRFTQDIRVGDGVDNDSDGQTDEADEGDGIDNDRDGQTDESDEWYDASIDDPNEDVRFRLWREGGVNCDANEDGVADSFPCSLARDTGGGLQRVADNVEALRFFYLDANGRETATAANIRTIVAALVVSSDNPVLMRDHTDRTIYQITVPDAGGNPVVKTILDKSASPDTRRRIMLSTEIRIRNTGLTS